MTVRTDRHRSRPGPADAITGVRAGLVVAIVVVLVTGVAPGPGGVAATVTGLGSLALLLDGVDGWVARRTGTESVRGARFDMETDAALIAVLSGYVATRLGGWVLLIGAARYLVAGVRLAVPRLRGTAPPRYWCKVVAVIQGVALLVAASGVVGISASRWLVAGALVLLLESFGRELGEVWRGRTAATRRVDADGLRTGLGVVALWVVLVLPDRASAITVGSLLRIPLELLVLAWLVLLIRDRGGQVVAAGFGVLVGPLLVLKLADIGFRLVLDRPFELLFDWTYLGSAVGVVAAGHGEPAAVLTVVVTGTAILAVTAGLLGAALRLRSAVLARPHAWAGVLGTLTVCWLVASVASLAPAGSPIAASAAGYVYDQVARARAGLQDRREFAAQIVADPYRDAAPARLLGGLRGKDVLLVFVESYGASAVTDPRISPTIRATLHDGGLRLREAGYHTRSAWLTSPTSGAASWLAHSTLQSGLWVDSQHRYDQLLGADRMTLTRAFSRAGWRTVFSVPANTEDWDEGAAFYGFDTLYDSRSMGYAGPRFGYAPIPDQYTLADFGHRELVATDRPRVMAEIDLISSHHPWTPLPRQVPWSEVGDGSVFAGMPEAGPTEAEVFADSDRVRAAYTAAVDYTWRTLVSWLVTRRGSDLVLVVLGDHQPHSYVTGEGAGHDVPVTVIAEDPAVIDRIDRWAWHPGLLPASDGPIWRMDSFRDRFFTAFQERRVAPEPAHTP